MSRAKTYQDQASKKQVRSKTNPRPFLKESWELHDLKCPRSSNSFQAATSWGSSTALVAALAPSGGPKLGVNNLGDSGLRRGPNNTLDGYAWQCDEPTLDLETERIATQLLSAPGCCVGKMAWTPRSLAVFTLLGASWQQKRVTGRKAVSAVGQKVWSTKTLFGLCCVSDCMWGTTAQQHAFNLPYQLQNLAGEEECFLLWLAVVDKA